jgi:hypothetical protein
MIIIPIGVDCGLATLLKKSGIRNCSFPFDWVVSYSGVSKIISNNFENFLHDVNSDKINKTYDLCFYHNTFPEDYDKMTRRINRLLDLLNNTEDEVIFIRKGHAFHHHDESNRHKVNLANDIDDAEELNKILKNKYPKLKYKIIVALVCDTCFDKNKVYSSDNDNIYIFNIATPTYDDDKFEKLFNDVIFKKIYNYLF